MHAQTNTRAPSMSTSFRLSRRSFLARLPHVEIFVNINAYFINKDSGTNARANESTRAPNASTSFRLLGEIAPGASAACRDFR